MTFFEIVYLSLITFAMVCAVFCFSEFFGIRQKRIGVEYKERSAYEHRHVYHVSGLASIRRKLNQKAPDITYVRYLRMWRADIWKWLWMEKSKGWEICA